MSRDEALAKLHDYARDVRAMGATSLYLYGSTARAEASPESDLDIYIDYDPASRFNAFDLIGIKQFLERQLGSSVDLTTRDGLHPRLREGITTSAIRIF
jgi:uncharacterized protein